MRPSLTKARFASVRDSSTVKDNRTTLNHHFTLECIGDKEVGHCYSTPFRNKSVCSLPHLPGASSYYENYDL
jgi:hypothetical protein